MLDLETMGMGPNAAILAIGAVEFDVTGIGGRFLANIHLASAVKHGGVMDADTVLWWLDQSQEARKVLLESTVTVPQALQAFSGWMANINNGDGVLVWGNGAGFDNVVLRSAYERANVKCPWGGFRNDRCYRTIRAMFPEDVLERTSTQHSALDDAIYQAEHMVKILQTEGLTI